ncbi:PREDICTED: peptidyl-prolyl cis-trans isomerase-like 2 [Priapulus caudatus]|uniref:RING-type E3 ubiquitin transferase n=1 Tax=Priapulus caudatus TaxID=37621 RepID=A0ABM1EVC1_PRICU|nr:PREDICTED: peptidyl-prolyl cis-trans isomerase-like 2 [Priapulus caudatus]
MGKKQHQSDKLYLTTKEWSQFYGGHKTRPGKDKSDFKRLPFDCCSLSFQPVEHPLCTPDGVVFDLMNIVPYLKQHGHNPITGEPLDAKSLIKLTFHKNNDGKYHCPVMYRVFTENSHIVAIRTTGNVFSMEAVEQLNIKTKNLMDLLSSEPFTRKDIITIQDPHSLDKFDISKFHHVQKNLKVSDPDEERAKKNPQYHLKYISVEARETLSELSATYTAPAVQEEVVQVADTLNAAHYSTGAVAAGFTSTTMDPETRHSAAIVDEDVVRYARVKKKSPPPSSPHLSLSSLSLPPTHLSLFSLQVPRTCENFIKLCETGYYRGTVFHRSIRNFMLQGGDPTATGKGGESIWGSTFRDEFKPNLTHSGRGVLSMANSGPNTNKSQFFITYRSCRHLDNKHSVFGRVVGGLDVLGSMEKVSVDDKDRPTKDLIIETTQVFVNPYDEADEQHITEDV